MGWGAETSRWLSMQVERGWGLYDERHNLQYVGYSRNIVLAVKVCVCGGGGHVGEGVYLGRWDCVCVWGGGVLGHGAGFQGRG